MDYISVKRGNPLKKTKILAVINQKGGVGKSTTVVNLSAALSDAKKKVLVVDLDPQGNTSSGFGIEKESLEAGIYDAVIDGMDASELIVGTTEPRVFAIPTTIQLAGAEVELVQIEGREQRLKEALSAVSEHFDYVLIDCPPSLGLLTINALVAADELLIPIQCEFYALEGVSKLLETMKMVQSRLNPDLQIFGVLLTMYDSRTTLSRQVAEEVIKYFEKKVFKTIIPRNVKLSEAPSHGLPVTRYARLSKGAQAYIKLAREVIRRG
jgi:chromosome partitioning protein